MTDDQVVRDALVKIQGSEETNITINRYRANGDGVEEVSFDVPESDVEGVKEEVEQIADEVDEAETVDDITEATGVDFDPGNLETVEEQQETPPADTAPESDVEKAREVVREEGITSTDFISFRTALLDRGVDADDVSDLWSEVKSEGLIETGTRSGDDGGDGGDAEEEADAGDESESSDIPAGDFQLVLITTEGCAGCERAKEMLSEHIPDPIEVLNVQESDDAVDLVMSNDLPIRAPMLLKVFPDGSAERV